LLSYSQWLVNGGDQTQQESVRSLSRQYKAACGGKRPHPALVNGIKNYELKLCLDSVNEADIKGIAIAFPQFALLKRVQLWGKHFTEVALNPDISFEIEH
jgi:hypothetical protein